MKVIDPGHVYEVNVLDGDDFTLAPRITFVKREGEGYPGNVGHHAGTNIQELLRVCIDRVKYLDKQIHHEMNGGVIEDLQCALARLEYRAAERHGYPWDDEFVETIKDDIENEPTCKICGHIKCQVHK